MGLEKSNKKEFNLEDLNHTFQMRVNKTKLDQFKRIAKQKGFTSSTILRNFIDSVIKNSDPQIDIFEKKDFKWVKTLKR